MNDATSNAQMFLYMRGCYARSGMASIVRKPMRNRALWLRWLRENAQAYPSGWAASYLARLHCPSWRESLRNSA